MGGDLTNWKPPGEFSSQVGKKDIRDTTADTDGRDLGLFPSIR